MGGLTDTKVRGALADGIYGDGGGSQLYLRVQGKSKAWQFIYLDASKRRRTMGLGGYPAVSLAGARKKAEAARELMAAGVDPIADKRKALPPTFEVAAEAYIVSREAGWTPAVAQRYRSYLRGHLIDIGKLVVSTVDTHDIERVLKPIWGTATGDFARSFIERVLDYARVKYGLEDRPNPARYRGHIEHVLVQQGRAEQKSHEAMPWKHVPALMAQLDEVDTVTSRALALLIVCGFRQLEVRELRWREVGEKAITIPADRYKTRREHVVPLSDAMKRILRKMAPLANDRDSLVFPGARHGRPLSQHAFAKLLDNLGHTCSVHGFRASLTVWGVEAGGFTDDLMQRVLGHVVGTAVSRTYQRSDFFDAKRTVLQGWAEYVAP